MKILFKSIEQSPNEERQRKKSCMNQYDYSTIVVCPSCGEEVHVGSAGPAGLAQHEGKGPCRKSQAKKEQKRQTRTLFDVGLKRAKDIPATSSASQSTGLFVRITNFPCRLF